MKINKLELESDLLGYPVIRLTDWKSPVEVEKYVNAKDVVAEKSYIYTELKATHLTHIHLLEQMGFSFSEFRIHMSLDTEETDDFSKAFYPLVAEIITEKKDLDQAMRLLDKIPCDDRFSSDPMVPQGFTQKRNRANLEKSFRLFPDEWLVGLFNAQKDRLEGFWSMGISHNNEAFLFQHAVRSNSLQLKKSLDSLVFSFLKNNGINWIYAISTGFNIEEINRLVVSSGFRVTNSTVILRKILQPS